MKAIIGNGPLFTRDKNRPYLERGGIFVDGNRIREVGNFDELVRRHPEVDIVGAKGCHIRRHTRTLPAVRMSGL